MAAPRASPGPQLFPAKFLAEAAGAAPLQVFAAYVHNLVNAAALLWDDDYFQVVQAQKHHGEARTQNVQVRARALGKDMAKARVTAPPAAAPVAGQPAPAAKAAGQPAPSKRPPSTPRPPAGQLAAGKGKGEGKGQGK